MAVIVGKPGIYGRQAPSIPTPSKIYAPEPQRRRGTGKSISIPTGIEQSTLSPGEYGKPAPSIPTPISSEAREERRRGEGRSISVPTGIERREGEQAQAKQTLPQRIDKVLNAIAHGGTAAATFIISPYVQAPGSRVVYSDSGEAQVMSLSEASQKQYSTYTAGEKIGYYAGGLISSPIIFGGIHPVTEAKVYTVVKQTSPRTSKSIEFYQIGSKEYYGTSRAIHTKPTSAIIIKNGKIYPKGIRQTIFESKVYSGKKIIPFYGEEKSLLLSQRTRAMPFISKGSLVKATKLRATYGTETAGVTSKNIAISKTILRGSKIKLIKGESLQKAIFLKPNTKLTSFFITPKTAISPLTKTTLGVTAQHSAQAGAIAAKLLPIQSIKAIIPTIPIAATTLRQTTKQITYTTTIPAQSEQSMIKQATLSITKTQVTLPIIHAIPSQTSYQTPIQQTQPAIQPYIPSPTPPGLQVPIPATAPTKPATLPKLIYLPFEFVMPKMNWGKGYSQRIPVFTDYTPSLTAISFGWTDFALPKIETGLGYRPVLKKRKRRRR